VRDALSILVETVGSCGLGVEWASEVSELLRVRGAGARKGRRAEVDLGLLLALERHVYHVYIYIDKKLRCSLTRCPADGSSLPLYPFSLSSAWRPFHTFSGVRRDNARKNARGDFE
jgi:hypothetical protein